MTNAIRILLLTMLVLIYATDVRYKYAQLKETKVEYIIKHDTVLYFDYGKVQDAEMQIWIHEDFFKDSCTVIACDKYSQLIRKYLKNE